MQIACRETKCSHITGHVLEVNDVIKCKINYARTHLNQWNFLSSFPLLFLAGRMRAGMTFSILPLHDHNPPHWQFHARRSDSSSRNDAQQQLSKCPSTLSAQGRTNFKDVRQNTAISRIVLADVRECAKLRGSPSTPSAPLGAHMFSAARRSSARSVWTYL
ncbi:hypothetical protein J6590_086410 [Homalodisca vitripennis]|nr:hypothetical protein J6590_086410 [Homalodisca vitripennis]